MNKIISDAAEEFDMDRSKVVDIFELFWIGAAYTMRGNNFPQIYIPKFGYFKTSLRKLGGKIKWLMENDGEKEDIDKYKKVLKRVKNERKSRKRG